MGHATHKCSVQLFGQTVLLHSVRSKSLAFDMLLQEVAKSVVYILLTVVCAQALEFVTEFIFRSGFEKFEMGKDLALFFQQVDGVSVGVVIDEGNESAHVAECKSP